MYLPLLTLATLVVSSLCRSTPAIRSAPVGPSSGYFPKLEFAFSVKIYKSDPFPLVSVSGGSRIIEPFYANGTVAGPLLNGTVLGGQETGTFSYNMTVFSPIVTAYGRTDDGADFIATVAGVGPTKTSLFSQVEVVANPPYANYQNEFFLGLLTAKGSVTTMDVYLVQAVTPGS